MYFHLSLRRLSPLAACCSLLLAAAGPAAAATYNVSELVLGTAQPLPPAPWIGATSASSCRYASVSGAMMANGYTIWPGAYATNGWPVSFSATPPLYDPAQVQLVVPDPPAGQAYDTLFGDPLPRQRARVVFSASAAMPASARQLDVQTWRSGSGASAASYAVRIEAPAGPARPTFLSFGVPTPVRESKRAGHIAGPSGQQPFTIYPKRMQARSIVDVYVDGLPVWSSESLLLMPQRRSDPWGQTEISWGPALDGSRATLFLGSLPAGSVRTAVIVLRSDVRADASACDVEPNQFLGVDLRRCNAEAEGLSLPTKSGPPTYGHVPDISVMRL
jgi:hypothetical protein